MKPADAVFEGGGVKAIGLVGALIEAENRGYRWVNVAGTSSGSIVAALVAAGYNAQELKETIFELNFAHFLDLNWLGSLPLIGPAINLWVKNGVFEGKSLEHWIKKKLEAKGVKTFGDLINTGINRNSFSRYKLTVIATDVTRRRLLRLPHDIIDYGIQPEKLEVATAIRMSSSIPFFFKPITLKSRDETGKEVTSYIVDGGVLSNFPIWLFDEKNNSWPTFGFKLVEMNEKCKHRDIKEPFDLLKAMVSTMLEAHDNLYELELINKVRTVAIPTLGIRSVDFELSSSEKEKLYQSGLKAAKNFFDNWNFDQFKKAYKNINLSPVPIESGETLS